MKRIYDDELDATVLIETVLWAKRLEERGEIETTEADDLYDFSDNCTRIAEMAYLEEDRAEHLMMEGKAYEGGFDPWGLMYEVIDRELRKTWGKAEKKCTQWVLNTTDEFVYVTQHGKDDYSLCYLYADWSVRGTLESVLEELTDEDMKAKIRRTCGGAA